MWTILLFLDQCTESCERKITKLIIPSYQISIGSIVLIEERCGRWARFKEFFSKELVRTLFSIVDTRTYLTSLSGKILSGNTYSHRVLAIFHRATAMYTTTILMMYTLNSPHCQRGATQSWTIQ